MFCCEIINQIIKNNNLIKLKTNVNINYDINN